MNTQVMLGKPKGRLYLKEELNSFIVTNDKEHLDQLINENLISLINQLFPKGDNLIGSYMAMAEEPNIVLPNSWRVSYPIVESSTEINFYTNPTNEFSLSKFGVQEPVKAIGNKLESNKHNAFIIPAVGFNQSGYRLGHGGGYYDRYLSEISNIKIGVGYSVQITDGLWLPEEHDIQLDYIVTEKYVVKINN